MVEECLLAVLNLYVRINFSVATFCADYAGSDATESMAASVRKLSDPVVQSVSTADQTVDVSGETIRLSVSLRSAVDS
jgi:hypothetical protein